MDVQLLTSAFLLLMFSQGTLQGSNEKHLLHYLFKEKFYNVMERPVENESHPLIVKFGMILQQIIDVDEKNQIIYTNIWLQMKWKDTNLQWDPYEFGGIKSLRIPAKEIWRPDILMYNSADEAFDGTYHTNVIVDHQGNALWVPPGMFKSTCAIDITWFPFDDQKCSLKFGSWTYDGRFIDLYMDNEAGGDTTTFIRNGEWDLTGVPGVKNVKTYQCCPERYIDITYTIHIRRRTLYYGFNIIIPCLLISSMSLLLFMLPPDAGEKISLGVTILLSLMVFLLLVAETMPPTSDALPLIGIYFCCIMIMCSLSVLCTVIVLNYHHRGPETHKLPQWVKRGINGWLAYALRMKRPEMDKRKQTIIQRDRLGDIHMNERTTHTLLPNLLELEEDVHASPAAENGICGVPSLTRDEWMGNVSCDSSSKVADCSAACVRRYMISILKEIRKITAKLKREEEDSEIKNEWKFAALVIDRLCFWICLTFTLTSTLTILFSAPHLVA